MKQEALEVGLSRDELSHTAIQGTFKRVVPAREDEHDAPRAPNISFSTYVCRVTSGYIEGSRRARVKPRQVG